MIRARYGVRAGSLDDYYSDMFLATVKDLPLMRLGETYLLLAEAQFKQGNTTGAATSLNVLRTRAQAPQVVAASIDPDFILDERARELIGEEQRRLTLVRTGAHPAPQRQRPLRDWPAARKRAAAHSAVRNRP